ncbi:unnamed protein product, partial [Musa banksii]
LAFAPQIIGKRRGRAAFAPQQEKGGRLPKFGEWDVNNSASAQGFTVMFDKARDEKKTKRTSKGRSHLPVSKKKQKVVLLWLTAGEGRATSAGSSWSKHTSVLYIIYQNDRGVMMDGEQFIYLPLYCKIRLCILSRWE